MDKQYVVFLHSPPYPSRGCYLDAIRIPKGKTFDDVRDQLPPTLINHIEVTAANQRIAKAIGLKRIVDGD